MDSEEDSWLLPAAKPWWPEAQLWPGVDVEAAQERERGVGAARVGGVPDQQVLTMPPQAESAAQAGSYWATIAAAYT